MREKFNPKDIKFIITCLLIGVTSTFFALSYFRQAFPEASINFLKLELSTEIKKETIFKRIGLKSNFSISLFISFHSIQKNTWY